MERHNFDAAYLEKLTAGDAETEAHFFRYFGELLAVKLRPRLRDPHLVEDARQETLLRVLRSVRDGAISRPEALGSFVNSTGNHVLFEFYRQQQRLPALADPPPDRAADSPGADAELINEEDRRQVRQVLAELSAKDRQILRWLFFEERDKADICRQLNVEADYLRVLLHRAKQRFRSGFLKRQAAAGGRI